MVREMCTVVVLRRRGHRWPVLLAANRDEMADRPARPPGRHWPDRPEVVAGLDVLAGGTWLGLNDFGVVAAVMNRIGSLGPAPDKRSRGELVLEALDHAEAAAAATALAALVPAAYRPFNLVVADHQDAYWLKHAGDGRIEVTPLPDGLSMLTAHDLNDAQSPRIAAYLPRFRAAPVPDPDAGDWQAWEALLASGAPRANGGGIDAAMCVITDGGFGTVSSALVALPGPEREANKRVWRFADGRPGEAAFADVAG